MRPPLPGAVPPVTTPLPGVEAADRVFDAPPLPQPTIAPTPSTSTAHVDNPICFMATPQEPLCLWAPAAVSKSGRSDHCGGLLLGSPASLHNLHPLGSFAASSRISGALLVRSCLSAPSRRYPLYLHLPVVSRSMGKSVRVLQ